MGNLLDEFNRRRKLLSFLGLYGDVVDRFIFYELIFNVYDWNKEIVNGLIGNIDDTNDTESHTYTEDDDDELPTEITGLLNPHKIKGTTKIINISDREIKRYVELVFSKLADDISNQEIDGDEYWDVRELVSRNITKKNILKCKTDFKRESLYLILDTSPSCEPFSKFLSQIFKASLRQNDVRVFFAPNGHIVSEYTKKGVIPLDETMMNYSKNGMYGLWNFTDKKVIFFGDLDGVHILTQSSKKNRVMWFFLGSNTNNIPKEYKGKTANCRNAIEFVKAVKKLRF
jgi:hypothetical protein